MGTPVPFTLPVFEDDKWYNCHLDCFADGGAPNTCEDDFLGKVECCKLGLDINLWLAVGCECNYDPPTWYELCFYNGVSAQRLLHVHGPYDTWSECSDVALNDCEYCDESATPPALTVIFSGIQDCSCGGIDNKNSTHGFAACLNGIHVLPNDWVQPCEWTGYIPCDGVFLRWLDAGCAGGSYGIYECQPGDNFQIRVRRLENVLWMDVRCTVPAPGGETRPHLFRGSTDEIINCAGGTISNSLICYDVLSFMMPVSHQGICTITELWA